MNTGNKYWLSHPDCENGTRLLTAQPTLEKAQEIGKRYGEKTQIALRDNNEVVKILWILDTKWKEIKL